MARRFGIPRPPMAFRVAPDGHERSHDFVRAFARNPPPLEAVLPEDVRHLLRGVDAVLIVDDTPLPKQRAHSVGVARRYAGAGGKPADGRMH